MRSQYEDAPMLSDVDRRILVVRAGLLWWVQVRGVVGPARVAGPARPVFRA